MRSKADETFVIVEILLLYVLLPTPRICYSHLTWHFTGHSKRNGEAFWMSGRLVEERLVGV